MRCLQTKIYRSRARLIGKPNNSFAGLAGTEKNSKRIMHAAKQVSRLLASLQLARFRDRIEMLLPFRPNSHGSGTIAAARDKGFAHVHECVCARARERESSRHEGEGGQQVAPAVGVRCDPLHLTRVISTLCAKSACTLRAASEREASFFSKLGMRFLAYTRR